MILAELVRSSSFELALSPYSPFVYSSRVGGFAYASFWIETFGAPDDSRSERRNVRQVTRDYLNKYIPTASVSACVAQVGSYYFDDANQTVYIHIEHADSPETAALGYGFAFGMTDREVIYIDDYEYLPLIESVPNLERSADLLNASKISGVSGGAELRNRAAGKDGPLDFLIDENVQGNDFFVYSYNPDTGVKTSRAVLYIEDYSFSLSKVSLNLQDKRKSQNIKVPTAKFDKAAYPFIEDAAVGKTIPLVYGTISEIELTPINPNDRHEDATVKAQYRMPDGLSNIGTVQVYVENTWTPAAGAVADFETMLLTVDNGRDSNGATRRLKLIGCVGIMYSGHSYPAHVILDLNARFLGLTFTEANYNVTEWTAEAASYLMTTDIGFALTEQKELYEVIFEITNKSASVFRYEFTSDNRITIRVRNFDRTVAGYVGSADIKNRDELPVDSDASNVFASVILKYAHNYVEDTDLSLENYSHYDEVVSKYRSVESHEIYTFLITKADASARAAEDAHTFSEIPHIVSLELFGFLNLKIYDTLDVALTADDLYLDSREYFGVRKCLVLSINPDDASGINRITALVSPTASTAALLERAIADSYACPSRSNVQDSAALAIAAQATADTAALALIRIGCSAPIVFRNASGAYHPDSVQFEAHYPDGSPYAGRWRLFRGNYLEYESAANESFASVLCAIAVDGTKPVSGLRPFGSSTFRAELFEAGGFGFQIASFSTATMADVDGFAGAYASAAEERARTISAAYADGKVSAEEARAIADATAKANAALASAQSYADTLAATLQGQIDGAVSSWFFTGAPTLDNAPAVDWTTDALKIAHLADLYYDLTSGYAYRFIVDGGVYSWLLIADTALTEALAIASAAQAAADSKTTDFATLALAQATGKIGDTFFDAGIRYRTTVADAAITLANSTRISRKKYPDVADLAALNALTGMIFDDYVFRLDTLQMYSYDGAAWVTDGIAQDGSKTWIQDGAPTIGARPNARNGDYWIKAEIEYLAVAGSWVLQGPAGRITCSTPVVMRHKDNTYKPASVTFAAKKPDGSAYSGRWKLYRGEFLEYTSAADESSATIDCAIKVDGSVPVSGNRPFGSSTFRAELYAAGGTTIKLDVYSTATMADVDGFASTYADTAEARAIAKAAELATAAQIAAQAAAVAAAAAGVPDWSPRYLGPLTADPTFGIRKDDFYFRTNATPKKIRRYSGSAWADVPSTDARYGFYIGAALNDMTAIALVEGDDGFTFFVNLVARNFWSFAIRILSGGSLGSDNFDSGNLGFMIDDLGNAEFNSFRARGEIELKGYTAGDAHSMRKRSFDGYDLAACSTQSTSYVHVAWFEVPFSGTIRVYLVINGSGGYGGYFRLHNLTRGTWSTEHYTAGQPNLPGTVSDDIEVGYGDIIEVYAKTENGSYAASLRSLELKCNEIPSVARYTLIFSLYNNNPVPR